MRETNSDRLALPAVVEARSADRHICEEAGRRLCSSSHYHLREMACTSECGVLTVCGRVPSYYLKQVIQSLLTGIDGVERIVNDVDVVNIKGLSSVQKKRPREEATESGQPASRTRRQ